MKNYICIDGNKIKISKETAENLKGQFVKEKDNVQGIIDTINCYSKPIERETINGVEYVKFPLPMANDKWTFWAFDAVKEFCERYDGTCWPYHMDKPEFNNADWLYVEIID